MTQQPIAGVAPASLAEVSIMTVWPSMAGMPLGRLLGRLYGIRAGLGYILTVGNLLALASIPLALGIYLVRACPLWQLRYKLTNRRVIICRGVAEREERSISLDDFDAIDVSVLPGQEWFRAGELTFRRGNIESLRLSGVPRPETFRATCLKAQRAHAGLKQATKRQAVAV